MIGNPRSSSLDKDKLYQLYVIDHMRLVDVGKIFGVSSDIIRKNLKNYNIPIRKKGYGFNVLSEFSFTKDQLDFFDGLMAGDGSVPRRKNIKGKKTIGNDFLSCGFKHQEFAQYIVNYLGLKTKVKPYTHVDENKYIAGQYLQYKFVSQSNIFFTKQRDRWYKNNIKIIPEDFRFSPISMNILYLGDGNLQPNNTINIYTMSFTKEDIYILINELNKIGVKGQIKNSKNKLNVLQIKDSEKFLEYIGSCPVDCYWYKWDIVKTQQKYKKIDVEYLTELYKNTNNSIKDIGRELGLSYGQVMHRLKENNLSTIKRKRK